MGTDHHMSELLNELLVRLYSDEGTLFGHQGTIDWAPRAMKLAQWLLRWN